MGNDGNRKLILARRARFVAAALASVAATTTALAGALEACGGETEEPRTEGKDAGPRPCLSPTANPTPCLGVALPPDAGSATDGGADDAGLDAEPQPCLAPRPPDGG
ncbi:MAG: hypothetical protein KF764_18505 [Labilithrix sp.]|nr:hypothetical protein [Labilithrix sp.]MBX3219974.1 hypothetical protein [Labilithrix sp.]